VRIRQNDDRRLRQLERQTNYYDPESYAALLMARLRAGQLSRLRIVLASEFHPAADLVRNWLGLPRHRFLTHGEVYGPEYRWPDRAKITPRDSWSDRGFDQTGAVRGYVISTNDGTGSGEYYRIEPTGVWYEGEEGGDEEDSWRHAARVLAVDYALLTPSFDLEQTLADADRYGSLDAAMGTRFHDAGGDGPVDDRVAWWQVRADAFHGDHHAIRVLVFLKHVYEQTLREAARRGRHRTGWSRPEFLPVIAQSERSEYLRVLIPVDTLLEYGDASAQALPVFVPDIDQLQRAWEERLGRVILGDEQPPSPAELLPRKPPQANPGRTESRLRKLERAVRSGDLSALDPLYHARWTVTA
jgi:hypothetical protein